MIFVIQTSLGQKTKQWTDIDTLETFEDKTYVKFSTYTDSILQKTGTAYLYPCNLEIRKSRLLPRSFKTIVEVDSMVYHGEITNQWKNGKYSKSYYDNGVKYQYTYYDSTDTEIKYREFYEGHRSHWDPEKGNGFYLFYGTKKKKKK
jgi:hypothetical protein